MKIKVSNLLWTLLFVSSKLVLNDQVESEEKTKIDSVQNKCLKQKSKPCNLISFDCLDCSQDPQKIDCIYGEPMSINCSLKWNSTIECEGEKNFTRTGTCRFCYQTPDWMHICTPNYGCKRDSSTRLYKVNCTVAKHVFCLGSRNFNKNVECNWTSGYKWNMAMILSLTLGGFGIDRFYLGHFREGLGKLFSFGGLGIWTLVDVVLIYVGYIGPADGSIYI